MSVRTLSQALVDVQEALSRKKASVFISSGPDGNTKNLGALAVGAPSAIRTKNGFTFSLGLTQERLTDIRDACNELLFGDLGSACDKSGEPIAGGYGGGKSIKELHEETVEWLARLHIGDIAVATECGQRIGVSEGEAARIAQRAYDSLSADSKERAKKDAKALLQQIMGRLVGAEPKS